MKRTPEGYRPVADYTAGELHKILVDDAVRNHATFLPWAIQAYERIGKLRGAGAEQAFIDVLDDVESRTGLRHMPIASPATRAELKAFGL